MKLLVLTNGKFEIKEITNELEDLQKIVGGYIESDGPDAQRYWWTEMFIAVFKD